MKTFTDQRKIQELFSLIALLSVVFLPLEQGAFSAPDSPKTSTAHSKNRPPAHLQMTEAHRVNPSRFPLDEINIVILDSRIEKDHPHLKSAVKKVQNVVEKVKGKALASATKSTMDVKSTAVAGLIGAPAQSRSRYSIAPGVNIHNIVVRSPNKKAFWGDVLKGLGKVLEMANNQPIHAVLLASSQHDLSRVNMPKMGSLEGDDEFFSKLMREEVPVVVGAGDQGKHIKQSLLNEDPISAQTITVSAYNQKKKQFAEFSNYGSHVDLIAPGTKIQSTFRSGSSKQGLTERFNGTDIAAAQVAATIGLIQAARRKNDRPHLSPDQLKRVLKRSGKKPSSGKSWKGDPDQISEPMLNVNRAVEKAASDNIFQKEYKEGTLAELPVDNNPSCKSHEYKRENWRNWKDLDNDCQDVRDEVLIEESVEEVTFETSERCDVETGKWVSPYDGVVETKASRLDIDHFVPLENAHDSGGCNWSEDKKEKYANYMGNLHHLAATSMSANRSKGGEAPHEWKPSDGKYLCQYATNWINVKKKWGLSVTKEEKEHLEGMLGHCGQNKN